MKSADIILLCVKPQVMDTVLVQIKEQISRKQLGDFRRSGVSFSTHSTTCREKRFPYSCTIPNTPAVIQEVPCSFGRKFRYLPGHLHLAQSIFESVGKVVMVEESLMDAVTGLSGSGPAYIYLVIEALTDGGGLVSLPRTVASVLAAQTVLGAADGP
ncbi:MAG: pyrroline-5-carboxylate reductase dimerization domain-containing protein [Nitrospirales bacterium]|nr:hypothetical protein [Nitrospirales bacterium]